MFVALGTLLAAVAASAASEPHAKMLSARAEPSPKCEGDRGYITLIAADWTTVSKFGDYGRPRWSLFGGAGSANQTKFEIEGDYTRERFDLKTFKSSDPAYSTWQSAWDAQAIDYGPRLSCEISVPHSLEKGVCWDITVRFPDKDGVAISEPPAGVTAFCSYDGRP